MLLQNTKDWIDQTPIQKRKELGQYPTPDNIKEILFKFLPTNTNFVSVLEPSVGTGEFIPFIKNHFINGCIDSYEIDETLSKFCFDGVDYYWGDFLKTNITKKYDFIIGNPPYMEIHIDNLIKEEFKEVVSGRVNIYSLFIKKCIDLLKDDGYLAFVVPTSMNNGSYFSKLREYIIKNCEILHLIDFKDGLHFDGAIQNVQIVILQKKKNTGLNIFSFKGLNYLTSDYLSLYKKIENKKTLKDLGFKVKTGTITWNQHKEKLTNDNSKSKLIWSNNIGTDCRFKEYNHDIKKQYIDINKSDIYPAILFNRITGLGSNLNLRAIYINEPYLAENHVNVIISNDIDLLKDIYNKIINDDSCKDLLRSLIGSTQVSKTELENLLIF